MKFLNRLFDLFFEQRAMRRELASYRAILRLRSEEDFLRCWQQVQGDVDFGLIRAVAESLHLPTPYIFPQDPSRVLFLNPEMDMRDVQAIILLEKKGGIRFSRRNPLAPYPTARELFSSYRPAHQ